MTEIESAKKKVQLARLNLRKAEEQLRHLEEERRLTEEQRETQTRLKWLTDQINEMDVNEITAIILERRA